MSDLDYKNDQSDLEYKNDHYCASDPDCPYCRIDELEARLAEDGWVLTEDRLPSPETPVLVFLNRYAEPVVAALYWEYPTYEESWRAFKYWDCCITGQAWEHDSVVAWHPLPELPTEPLEEQEQ